MFMKQAPIGAIQKAFWISGISIALLFVLAPVYILIKYSISDVASINTGGAPIPLWPFHPTLRTYIYLFSDPQF